jgi:type II secretory pathway predicted ATPase ExeA
MSKNRYGGFSLMRLRTIFEGSRMNDSRFAFKHAPFPAVPLLEHYVNVGNSDAICKQCVDSIQRDAGPSVVLGGAGLGKTITCMRIVQACSNFGETIFMSSSQIASRADLLKSLLYELRMPYRGLFDGELRLSLIERLQHRSSRSNERVALIVDEAQALSPRLLEELRLLTNLTVSGQPCLSLILCGSLKLEEMLANPQLESLQQRITARHCLRPLTQAECREYIRHRIELAGVAMSRVFDNAAIDAIFLVSNGIPRLIDQIANRTISNSGFDQAITAADIERAWQNAEQPTLPWTDVAGLTVTSTSEARYVGLEEGLSIDKTSANYTTPLPKPMAKEPIIAISALGKTPSAGMGLSSVLNRDAESNRTPSKTSEDSVRTFEERLEGFDFRAVTTAIHNETGSALHTEDLHQAEVSYGQEPKSIESFNLQPTSSQIEDDLYDLVSNMNLESISIDPYLENNLDRMLPEASHHDAFESQWSVNSDRDAMGSFTEINPMSGSFFRDIDDIRSASSADESISSSNMFDDFKDDASLTNRMLELDDISTVSRGISDSVSMAGFDELDEHTFHDDRDIIIVEEDIDRISGLQSTSPTDGPVATALLKSYSQLFGELRTS